MLTTVHYFTRRASGERRLARQALTEAARERHAALAAHFTTLAEQAGESQQPQQQPQQSLAVGQG